MIPPRLQQRLAELARDFTVHDDGPDETISAQGEVLRATGLSLAFLSACAPRARSAIELYAMVTTALAQMLREQLDARLPAVGAPSAEHR